MTEKPEIEVVYLGRRMIAGKTYLAFMPYETLSAKGGDSFDKIDRSASLFSARSGPSVIGGVYVGSGVVEDGEVKTLNLAGLKYRRTEHWREQATWEAYDRSAQTEQRRQTLENRAAKDRKLDRPIAEIKAVYKNLAPADRLAFQVWLINQLIK